MRQALRLIGVFALVLGMSAAALAAEAPPGPEQEAGGGTLQAKDPVVDAIGQRMSGAAGEAAESGAEGQGAFPSFGRLVFQLVVALAFTLGGLYAGLLGLRHLLGKKGSVASPHIQVIAKASLSPKASVYLVEVAGQTLVVGEGAGELSLLTTVTDPKALAPRAAEQEDEAALQWPKGRERVAAALSRFGEQLGLSQRRLNAQSLSVKLREGTRAVRALSRRLGRRADDSTVESARLPRD